MEEDGIMASKNKIKGWKTQRECIKLLESEGWLVSKVEIAHKFAKHKDLWGLWDLACIRDNLIKFVQVKTNQLGSMKPYKKFAFEHPIPNVSWELWCRKDYAKRVQDRWDIRVFEGGIK